MQQIGREKTGDVAAGKQSKARQEAETGLGTENGVGERGREWGRAGTGTGTGTGTFTFTFTFTFTLKRESNAVALTRGVSGF
jgi:hypothetical protein